MGPPEDPITSGGDSNATLIFFFRALLGSGRRPHIPSPSRSDLEYRGGH